jgi:hypothetical protein
MRRRTKATILVIVIVLLALAAAIYLRKKAPPEAARLLPESDGIVYVNVAPIRAATHFDRHQVNYAYEYQQFINATGIDPERDLDEAAVALHRMDNPLGPNGAVAFSEVFVGHFDAKRLTRYLDGTARSKENYAGHDIYSIPSEGRIDRVAILGYDMVAVSNTPTAEQIHSILDRYRTAALPFAGSTLLSRHYQEVPLLSLAWGVGKIGLPLVGNGGIKVLGMTIPLSIDTTFIASLVWRGNVHLRVEEIAPTESAAALSASSLQAFVSIFRAAEDNLPGGMTDPQVRDLLNSTNVEHHKDRAILTATVPSPLIQKLISSPQNLGGLPNPAQK